MKKTKLITSAILAMTISMSVGASVIMTTLTQKIDSHYDVQGWKNFYQRNPNHNPSVGADGDNNDENNSGGFNVNSAEFKAAVAEAVGQATSGLKTKNDELLGKLKVSSDKLSGFGDIDPETFGNMMKNFNSSEEAKMIADGKIDELIAKRTDKMKSQHDDQMAQLTERYDAVKSSSDKYQASLKTKVIEDAIRAKAFEAKILPEALQDVLRRASDVFSLSDDGTLEARDKDGQLVKTSDGFLLNEERFIASLKEVAPYYWPTSQGSGANGSGQGSDRDGGLDSLSDMTKGGKFDLNKYRAQRKKMSGDDYNRKL